MSITKTDFMRGMQCPRMLWLDKHHPEWKVIPPEIQQKLDGGNEFGDKAMGMFGPFEEMTEYIPNTSYPDKKKMVLNTKRHLKLGTANICEAAFDFNGSYCAVDILHKTETGYEMYEVKNSPEVKKQFIQDAGYQAWVLEKCGLKPEKVFIVYHGANEEDPYVPVDVTEEAGKYSAVVEANIDRLNVVKFSKFEICMEPGEQCSDPYECWYWNVCHKDELAESGR